MLARCLNSGRERRPERVSNHVGQRFNHRDFLDQEAALVGRIRAALERKIQNQLQRAIRGPGRKGSGGRDEMGKNPYDDGD